MTMQAMLWHVKAKNLSEQNTTVQTFAADQVSAASVTELVLCYI